MKADTLDSFIYSQLNNLLRNREENWTQLKKWFPYIEFLFYEFIQTETKIDLSTLSMLYRGTNLPESVVTNDYSDVGCVFSWPSFTSTSKSKNTAEFFAGRGLLADNYKVLFEI